MSETSIGAARIDIVVNADKAEAQVKALAQDLTNTAKAADGSANTISAASRRQIAALERQIATFGKSREEIIRWRIEQQTSGKVAEELKRKLEAQVAAVRAASTHFNQYGKSAKEVQLALRGVPAQLTDIFVSLQGGQNPLTVLLQQGGQLRDMFGGAAPAAQALGRSLLGLVNPATVAAAALTGIYLAYEGGASEARAFEQALIGTSRAIGVTVGDLQDMARALGANMSGTHAAAEALAEVAASGRFAGDQIAVVARAALAMEKATGQAVGETIKQFVRLGEEPVQAALKLNEQTHFLTLEVYEQIKALEQQGRTLDAQNVVMEAAARAAERMASDTKQNLGLLETAWHDVKAAAAAYLNILLEIGRAPSPNEQIGEIQQQIGALQDRLAGRAPFSFAHLNDEQVRQRIAQLRQQQTKLIREQTQAIKEAEKQAAQARAVEDKAAADAEVARFASNQEKLAAEKIRIQGVYAQRIANARKAGDEKLVRDLQEAQRKVEAGLEAQYREREKKPRAVSDRDSGASLLAQLRQRAAAMELELQTGERLNAAQQARIQLDALEAQSKGKLTAENKKLIEAEIERLEGLEELKDLEEVYQLVVDEAAKSLKASEEAKQRYHETAQRVIDDLQFENELMGKSALEQAKMIALRQAGVTATSEYGQQIEKLIEQHAKLAEQQALLDDVKLATEDMFASFIDGSKSASEAFEDFAKDLQRIAARLLAQKAVEWLFGAFLGGGAGGMSMGGVGTAGGGNPFGGIWASGYSTGGYTGPGGKYEPAGIVHKGEVVWSQDDVRRAGGVAVVEAMRRGLRGYAEGGVAAAPYVPLQPVRAAADAPKVTVVVENHGGGETRTEETTGPDGERMIRVIVNAAVSEVDKRIGSMGSTGRAIQQRFGLNPAGVSRG